jgi:hypothetical protein
MRRALTLFAVLSLACSGEIAHAGQTVAPSATQRDNLQSEQSRKLLNAVDTVLKKAAEARSRVKDLPSRDTFVIPPLWTETREDREQTIRPLLDAALEIVTDAPVVEIQTHIKTRRKTIADLRDAIAASREKRLTAPDSGFMPGVLTDTQRSLDADIVTMETRIRANEAEIDSLKAQVRDSLAKSGVSVSKEQLDLLLDSVLGGDLLRLVAAFQASRVIDLRLAELLTQSSGDLKAARRYFAMHAALFAMLVHAQSAVLEKIDRDYLPKLNAVMSSIKTSREKTYQLMGAQNRPDQRRALEANLKSQDLAEKVASYYKDYLQAQRRQVLAAHERTLHDLKIADNTYETVEASFELRALMDDARTSFEALLKLEAPGFDQIFQNESLRKEFEKLTEKLGPSS